MAEVRITVGRFALTLGGPHGTSAAPAAEPDPLSEEALAHALAAPPAPQPTAVTAVAGAIEQVEDVTSEVERASRLAEDLVRGLTLDRDVVERQLNRLIGLAERADRDGRFNDEIRLARALVTLLALLGRWVALVEALRRTASAAAAVGNPAGQAWAQHELGTFSLAAGDPQGAVERLEDAARRREAIGDQAGAGLSRRNLELARATLGSQPRFAHKALVVALVGAVTLLLAAGGLALVSELVRDDPATEVTSSTEQTTTEETTTAQENSPPRARDVRILPPEDVETSWTPDVDDPDGDELTCTIVEEPTSGTATVEEDCGGGTYTPAPNFDGTDTFAYEVRDGRGGRAGARVAVEVTPLNDPPEAEDVEIVTRRNRAADWEPAVSDIDGDELTCEIATGPENGTATVLEDCSAGVYVPDDDYEGDDTFTYVAIDQTGERAEATVSVTVVPPDVG